MRLHRTVAPTRRPGWRVTSTVSSGLGALLAVGWVSGCSVLYGLETEQCSSNADCDALGDVFVGLACENHLCVTPTISGCQSNAECMDTEGSGTEPYICRERECIALRTAECPTLLPQTDDLWRENLRSDSPLILAGSGVIGGTTAFDERLKNYDLALTEFTRRVGGLQGGARPLVMLGCQATFESPEQLDRMMTHLADEVRVPGFVATMLADDLQRAFVQKGLPANMFFMSPLDADPTLATLEDNGLLWHVGPRADRIAWAYAPLLTRTLTYLAITGTVRVATVVSSDERSATNTLSTIRADPGAYGIVYNGLSVFDNSEAQNYLGVTINSSDESFVAQIQQLIDFKPHVVISVASDGFPNNIVPQLETAWDEVAMGQPAPFYILSPFNYNSDALAALLATTPALSARMVGVNGAAAEDDSVYREYTLAWDEAFPGDAGKRGYENFYDAAYYTIYAAAGAGQFLTGDGQDLRRGMARLLSGPPFDVGYDAIPGALQALAPANATITLNGTLGAPNFNPLDGTRQSDGSVWCIDSSGVTHADVLRYVPDPGGDVTRASLSGDFPANCISGF